MMNPVIAWTTLALFDGLLPLPIVSTVISGQASMQLSGGTVGVGMGLGVGVAVGDGPVVGPARAGLVSATKAGLASSSMSLFDFDRDILSLSTVSTASTANSVSTTNSVVSTSAHSRPGACSPAGRQIAVSRPAPQVPSVRCEPTESDDSSPLRVCFAIYWRDDCPLGFLAREIAI